MKNPVEMKRSSSDAERRRKRSPQMGRALQLQLDTCREEGGLLAILVSDDLGLCVAESGATGRQDELAARLPRAAHAGLTDLPTTRTGLPVGISLKSFVVDRSELFVCAVGGRPDQQAASLNRVETGFRRILAA